MLTAAPPAGAQAGGAALEQATAQTTEATEPPPDLDAEVTIVVSRVRETAGSVHVLDEERLERFEYDDAHAVLGQVPGVYIRQEDGMGLRPNLGIRGGNPDRSKKLTLMEDGVLTGPAPYSASAAYFTPLLTRMTSVRVVKGPAAIAYGPQTVGGAVDFISRPIPIGAAAALDLGAGQYGYTKAHGHFGWSDEQVGFLVEGVRLGTSGFARLPSGADTGSTRSEWLAKASYVFDPGSPLRNALALKLTYSDEVSNETYLGQSDADLREDPYRRYPASALDQMNLHRTSVVLSHELEWPSGALRLRTDVYRHQLDRVWSKLNRLGAASAAAVLRAPDEPLNAGLYGVLTGELDSASRADTLYIGPNDRRLLTQGVQSTLHFEQRGALLEHRLQAGVRLHHDQVRRRHSERGYLMTAGELVADGEPELLTARNVASTTALALHLVDAISLSHLTLTPGVRLELMSSATHDRLTNEERDAFDHALMPGLGAYYALAPTLGVLAGVYRGFSPPAPASDDFVEPEYSVNYEAGVRYAAGRTRAELIGFYNDYSNLTDICTQSSGCLTQDLDRQFDAGAASILGLEAFAAHELTWGPLRAPLSVAYTLTRGEFDTSFSSSDPIYGDVDAGDALPYLPLHQLHASLALEASRFGGAAALTYVAPMREEAGSEPLDDAWATDEQLTLDLSVRGHLLGGLTLYANLRNATGAANLVGRRPYGARVNAPRWLQIGARLEL